MCVQDYAYMSSFNTGSWGGIPPVSLFNIKRGVIINKVGEKWERYAAKNKKRLQY